MKLRIEKYNAERLGEFTESAEIRGMPVLPVSEHRAISWLNNPRMCPDDILMYLAYEKGDLVGYRCILPDRHGDIRFGWLSSNWVSPRYRRRGIASQLFGEAFRDWKEHLMFTNYAPESRAVYDKSGHFGLYEERQGMRYYLRSAAAELLAAKGSLYRTLEPAISFADRFINVWQDVRIESSRKKNKADLLTAEPLESMDLESYAFLSSHNRLGFGLRDHKTFEWINDFPWIMESGSKDDRYFFSSGARSFRNHYLKILDQGGKMVAFLMLVRINNRMTVPYACVGEEGLEPGIKILDHYLAHNRISYFTTRNPEIISMMKNSRLPVLGRRKITQKYFATKDLLNILPGSSSVFIQDGDGDVVFT